MILRRAFRVPLFLIVLPLCFASLEARAERKVKEEAKPNQPLVSPGKSLVSPAKPMVTGSNVLERALRDSKVSGDLDGLLLLKKEIERAARQRIVPEEPPEGANATLLKLRNGYRLISLGLRVVFVSH